MNEEQRLLINSINARISELSANQILPTRIKSFRLEMYDQDVVSINTSYQLTLQNGNVIVLDSLNENELREINVGINLDVLDIDQ